MKLWSKFDRSSEGKMLEALANFLANPAFQYTAATVGGALGAANENPVAAALGGLVQQQITAKNYRDMLQQLLAGGGKVSLDGAAGKVKIESALNQQPTTTGGYTMGLVPAGQTRAQQMAGLGQPPEWASRKWGIAPFLGTK